MTSSRIDSDWLDRRRAKISRPLLLSVLFSILSAFIFIVVSLYTTAFRDARFLDGWLLTAGMIFQISFHIALKTKRLSPLRAARWRNAHIFNGYLLVAAFLSHASFSLPDTGFEWALWIGFVLVTASGVLGTYLSWSNRVSLDQRIGVDQLPARYKKVIEEVRAIVAESSDQNEPALPLPAQPHDQWIKDLYHTHLEDYFRKPCNLAAHLIGSEQLLKSLTGEIDDLSGYVGQTGQKKLSAIKALIAEKFQLDAFYVHALLTRVWLLIHVPVTYALGVLIVLHVIIAYAFSSGAW